MPPSGVGYLQLQEVSRLRGLRSPSRKAGQWSGPRISRQIMDFAEDCKKIEK